jgi:hypothetical protein
VKHWHLLSAWVPVEFWLYKKSTGLIWWIIFRFLRKGSLKMGFSKTLASGELGSVSVSESGGTLSLTATAQGSIGGGEAAGVVKFSSSNSLQITGAQLVQLAFEYIESKSSPGVVLIEKEVQAAALAAVSSA